MAADITAPKAWDTAYEFKAVGLLTVGFGLVGLDRWILPPLFPSMMKDLSLNYQDLGNLVGALGVAWGVSAIVMGNLSDRFGRRRVLVPAVVLFSLLSLFTGMATGLVSLLLIRGLMGAAEGAVAPRAPISAMFKHRNVGLAMVGLLCAMTGIFVISAIMPNYLTDFLKLSPQQMGFVTSAIGFGGFLGQLGLPALSDLLGRRTVALASFALAAVFLWLFIHTGVNMPVLFGLLFFASMFNFGALALIAGPIAAEAAPIGLMASVAGIVIGAGEIFGGGVAPSIAGGIAQNYGIQYTLYFAMAGQVLGLILCLFFKETSPSKAKSSKVGEVSELDQLEQTHPGGVTVK